MYSPRSTMNSSPRELIDNAPPVCVPEYATDGLPSGSSFTTVLLSFCATSNPPSLVPTMPSPLLPACCQTNVHFCPAAITPGIPVTVYSRTPCGGGTPRAPPRAPPGPPPLAGGGVLHVAINAV